MKLALIRHLPTASNRDGLLQGRLDVPILPPDEATRRQISHNRQQLQGFEPGFDQVLVSGLCRTAMTAELYGYGDEPLLEPLMEPRVEPLLDELDFGPFEAKPRSEMLSTLGDAWFEAPQTLVFGEPVVALGERVSAFLDKYAECGTLLIFGHGAWIRALLSMVEHGNLEQMNRTQIHNNQLLIVEVPKSAN